MWTSLQIFNILHLATMFKVDVFVTGADELLSIELSRKQRVRVLEEPRADLFVASPEDMVLQKLMWYRDGGEVSDRQWGDVIGVLKTQGNRMDLAYLHPYRRAQRAHSLLGKLLYAA